MNYKGLTCKNVYDDIQNTLKILQENNLVCFYNPVNFEHNDYNERISWVNHVPERKNCENYFNKLEQFFFFLEQSAYICILFDGSIIRASYNFIKKHNKLTSHNLLWWPSPINKDISEIFGKYDLSEYIKECIHEDLYNNILMRTPLRFDYDIDNVSKYHPKTHLHMQNNDCRIFVDRPLCFNKFIKFIFKNFYPQKFKQYNFWDNLDELKIGDVAIPDEKSNEFLALDNIYYIRSKL